MQRYQSDRAVRKRAEDLLGRVRFAEQLADALVAWREDASFVVSLTGPWGSGKTSIKNFVLDALAPEGGESRADVVEFTPWELSGTGDVEQEFFRRIGTYLGRRDAASQDRKIAKKWSKWTAGLQIPRAMVEPLTTHLSSSAVALVLAAMGFGAAAMLKLPWVIAGAIVVLLGILVPVAMTITERVSDYYTKRADMHDTSPSALKAELSALLHQRERPLLIVIDDVDRLTSGEIRLIFRLIKANADLPRLLYFVLFEREAVVHALEREGFASGERYLEKIIQAPFAVPTLQEPLLYEVIIDRFNEILRPLPDWAPEDERRWIDLFFQRLHVYFTTLRDVYRFLAAFEFHAGVFRDERSFEVNIVDLFVLDTLRMFEPKIYEQLEKNKRLLVHGTLSDFDRNTDASKNALQAMLEGAHDREAVKAALSMLFPRASWAWGGHHYADGFDAEWTAAKRVGTDTHFDKYFYFALPKGEIGQAELDRFVAASSQREAVARFIRDRKNDGRIERFMIRLEYEKDRVPLENAVPFVAGLFDEGDDLPRSTQMWGTDADMHLLRVVYWYLLRLKTVEERQNALSAAIRATTGLYGPAHVVSLEEPSDRKRPDRQALVHVDSLREFTELCAAKIAAAAEVGALLGHPHMVPLIYYWSSWRSEDEVRKWSENIIQTPAGAMSFLRSFVGMMKSQGMGSLVTKQTPRIDLKSVEKFVSLDLLDEKLPNADSEHQAIELFRKLLDRRRRGLPDREPLSRDDEEDE